MARGNCILVSTDSGGVGMFTEGIVKTAEAPKPGQIVVIDPSVALAQGRHTYKLYAPGTDGEMAGGGLAVVMEDAKIGRTTSDAYAAGERMPLYFPLPGNELNLLLGDVTGTGDDHALGEKLIVDTGTGKLIATTGSPEQEVAMLLEAVTDPTADTLAWCKWGNP